MQFIFSLEGNYVAKFMFGFTVLVILAVAIMFLYILVLLTKIGLNRKSPQQKIS